MKNIHAEHFNSPPRTPSTSFWVRIVIVLALFVPPGFSNTAFTQATLFQVANMNPSNLSSSQLAKYQKFLNSDATAELWIVQMNDFAQQVADQHLEIKIPGDNTSHSFRAKYVWAEPTVKIDWYGEIQLPDSTGYASFSQLDGEVRGYFTIEEEGYALYSLGSGLYLLIRFDDDDGVDCGFAVQGTGIETETQETQTAQDRDCNVVVKVLILHTAAAAEDYPISELTRQILISQANQTLANSHVWNNELVFVPIGGGLLTSFTESENINQDLKDLRDNSEAQNLRDSLKADCVVLLTDGDYDNIYGIAPNCGPSNAGSFCIVDLERGLSHRTFTHELGHLFGCKHSPGKGNGACEPDFERPHWFNFNGRDRYTVMENNVERKDRIPYFSNPDVKYHDHATGTHANLATGAVERDNARQLREKACEVASYRSSNDFKVHIDGDNQICEYETDSPYMYFANASGGASGPYFYFWEISNDGITYASPLNNTTSELILDFSNLNGGDLIFIRLKVTDAVGAVRYDYLTVEILDNESYICSERSEKAHESASKGKLFSLMPNPADGNTLARIMMAWESAPVTIEVYNAWGVLVQRVLQKLLSQEIQIETQNLATGIYWVKANSNGVVDVQKLIIIH